MSMCVCVCVYVRRGGVLDCVLCREDVKHTHALLLDLCINHQFACVCVSVYTNNVHTHTHTCIRSNNTRLSSI